MAGKGHMNSSLRCEAQSRQNSNSIRRLTDSHKRQRTRSSDVGGVDEVAQPCTEIMARAYRGGYRGTCSRTRSLSGRSSGTSAAVAPDRGNTPIRSSCAARQPRQGQSVRSA
jgi:hypothetical protein